MHVVWPLYCAGPAKVVLQSRQVKDELQDMRCLSSFGFFTVSPHAVYPQERYKREGGREGGGAKSDIALRTSLHSGYAGEGSSPSHLQTVSAAQQQI